MSRVVVWIFKCNHLHAVFKEGVDEYMVPSRVRGDRGGENVLIADFMLTYRALGRGSFIVGQANTITELCGDM